MIVTIDQLFDRAVARDASDLHIVAGSPPILRINGRLEVQSDIPPLTSEDTQSICFSILTQEQQQLFTERRDIDTGYSIKNDSHARSRINLHWEKGSAGMVARIIPASIPSIEELDMPKIVYDLLKTKQGLILVTGPTGCGKSTSLAAMVEYINNDRSEHIITLEDPIEFVFSPKKSVIRQRQLGADMLSFEEGLKHVVREDPNVIMVGEMRDLETISAAITLAETGHLVLATLHTANAMQTVDRIIDVFPPFQQDQVRFQVSYFLRAVISKRLLPREGGGRIGIYEVLLNNPAVATTIRESRIGQIKTIMQTSAKAGMITMEQSLRRALDSKLISKNSADVYIESMI